MIVESPNKIKKIKAVLASTGEKWEVLASVGHFRDLPASEMGINFDDNMKLTYEYSPDVKTGSRSFDGGKKRIKNMKDKMKDAQNIYLASDPDREGEAIAWHLKECLNLKDNYQRVTFNAIEAKAITEAINNGRLIDDNLVKAQEARRCIDRMIGYIVTPIVNKTLDGQDRVSVGRVQSPALKLVVDRQKAIDAFKSTKHYSGRVFFNDWSADLILKNVLKEGEEYILDAAIIENAISSDQYTVVDNKIEQSKKLAPSGFSTSLLIQAASNKLNLKTKETTMLAQKLFEEGLITYIRTDDVNIDKNVIPVMRDYMERNNIDISEKINVFKGKQGAQEAHECIRPTDFNLKDIDDADEKKKALYSLIWLRSIASQMPAAIYENYTITLKNSDGFLFEAKARTLIKKGWLSIYQDTEDEETGEEGENILHAPPFIDLKQDHVLQKTSSELLEKNTVAPKRFTEASLVNTLENEGVGRPSTYASIMGLLTSRGYLLTEKKFLYPSELAKKIIDCLEKENFSFIQLKYTRELEKKLDEITDGNNDYLSVTTEVLDQLKKEAKNLGFFIAKPQETSEFKCQSCKKPLIKRNGNNGAFWGCSGYPKCKETYQDKDGEPDYPDPNIKIFRCPGCKSKLILRSGRNGAFWGCSGFPKCKKTFQDKDGEPIINAGTSKEK